MGDYVYHHETPYSIWDLKTGQLLMGAVGTIRGSQLTDRELWSGVALSWAPADCRKNWTLGVGGASTPTNNDTRGNI
jgi:hypothetical protein